MNNDQAYKDLTEAGRLLLSIRHDLLYRSESMNEYIKRDLSLVKALVDNAQLLLLNKPTEAITETAHCANTLLSECADSEDGQVIGDVGADSSETEIVKQNEQTKEVCPRCGDYGWIEDENEIKSICPCHR